MNPSTLEVHRLDDGGSVLLSNEIQVSGTFNFDRQTAVVRDANCAPNSAIRLEPQAASKCIPLVLRDRKRPGCTNSSVGIVAKKNAAGNRKSSSPNHVRVAHIT